MTDNQPKIINKNMRLEIQGKVNWGSNVTLSANCNNITIGFGSFIGNDVYIDAEELHIGDYFTIHHGSIIHGKKCIIGHNNWIGHYSILDSLGGLLKLGNNVGVGAHSQLWSHLKFGDRLAGCQWYRMDNLDVGDDVWFVGHCIVTAIKAEPRSMLMVGGIAVKDMKKNHIYAGAPAKDVSDKMGYQFREISLEEKKKIFHEYINEYEKQGNDTGFIKVVNSFNEIEKVNYTYFNLETREYTPQYSDYEYNFMKFLLYDRAKFIPLEKQIYSEI